MFKKIYSFINLNIFTIIVLVILIFPLISYKIGLEYPIFPAIEVILVYYLRNNNNYLKSWIIIFITIFIDQLNSLPLGTSLIAFIISNLIFKKVKFLMNTTNPIVDYLLFGGYAAVMFILKYFLIVFAGKSIAIIEFIFQYLTTLFIYPLFKFILDKRFSGLKDNVRSQNT